VLFRSSTPRSVATPTRSPARSSVARTTPWHWKDSTCDIHYARRSGRALHAAAASAAPLHGDGDDVDRLGRQRVGPHLRELRSHRHEGGPAWPAHARARALEP